MADTPTIATTSVRYSPGRSGLAQRRTDEHGWSFSVTTPETARNLQMPFLLGTNRIRPDSYSAKHDGPLRKLMQLACPIAGVTLHVSPVIAADLTLQQALLAPNHSPDFITRDHARHPLEELRFFGVTPQSSVVEIWPGGCYWTEILATYLHDHGVYHLAVDVADGEPEGQNFALGPNFARRLDADPGTYGNIDYTFFGRIHPELSSPASTDLVLTFRNLHNWINQGDAGVILASIHRALKADGILGVEDHRGNALLPQDPKATFGYVRQGYATALIEKAGFKLVGSSEVDANPRDKADYPRGVWTLPPTYALGDKDRAKYQAIGEADNFVLKFKRLDN